MRLKIEINSRERFSVLDLSKVPFSVNNRWFSGEADITTFQLDELLGTKLRALYQRKKGRDLFDLAHAINRGLVDVDTLPRCFHHYMEDGGHSTWRTAATA